MNLSLLKDIGQIFAWTAAGAFFAYRFYLGWFHPNLCLNLICDRRPAPIELARIPTDSLTIVANVKKGSNMTIRLIDLQACVTFGNEVREKKFESIERRCLEGKQVNWNGNPPAGPIYLSLAPGDETQFAAVFEVPSSEICTASVILFARKFIPGFGERSNTSANPHQWRASCVSLPCPSASDGKSPLNTTP